MDEVVLRTADERPWQRSESRQVRPFRYASDYLQDAALRLYDDGDFTTEEVVPTDEVDLPRFAPVVRISKPPALFEDVVGVSAEQLRFVTIVEDRFFKRATVVHECRLADIPSDLLYLGDHARRVASWRGETRVHLAVILGEDRKADVGYATRRGSWVARKSFRITKPTNSAVFPIQPVDEEWFVARRLPSKTAYLVQILEEDLNQPTAELSEAVKVFASKDLLTALAGGNQESAVNTALMKAIYTDVVTAVLATGMEDLEGDPSPNSLLDVIVTRLASGASIPRERVLELAREKGANELRAVVQAQAELARAMISAVRRKAA